jgi:hypothetical protein
MAWTNGTILCNLQHLASTRGPALTVWGEEVYMAYLGEGGKNLWLASFDPTMGDFTNWQTNQQIHSITGGSPTASDTPAIAQYVTENLQMVFAGPKGESLYWMETLAGSGANLGAPFTWPESSVIDKFNVSSGWNQPKLIVFDNKLQLIARDKNGQLWWTWQEFSFRGGSADDLWQSPVQLNVPSTPGYTWAIQNDTLYLINFTETQLFVSALQSATGATTPQAGSWHSPRAFAPAAGYAINPWGAAIFADDDLYVFYTDLKDVSGYGSGALAFAVLLLDEVVPGLAGNDYTAAANRTLEPPAVVAFGNTVLLAYKAVSSSNLHYTFTTF